MKIRSMVTGTAFLAAAMLATAETSGMASADGQGPLFSPGSGATVPAPAVRELNPRPGYWTPERYRGARSLPLPIHDDSIPQMQFDELSEDPASQETSPQQPPDARSGQPPLLEDSERELLEKRLYIPHDHRSGGDGLESERESSANTPTQQRSNKVALPLDVGIRSAYFSSQPLIPATADREYPYSTVGRLFFTIPDDGDYMCSGAVVAPRLVVTAGHCVHSGSGNERGWFVNFEFIPAYRDGDAPFATWKGSAVFVTDPWYNGRDKVPNIADYALIEMDDQLVGGVPRKIGEVAGYLGYQTESLIPNHAHLLGYPVAFDGGERMHQVTAQSFRKEKRYSTVLYGSDMTEGSSGGPWIMNFGPASAGQVGANDPGRNRIIGVTSYGFDTVQMQGSSVLDEHFTTMLNKACAHREGNCQ